METPSSTWITRSQASSATTQQKTKQERPNANANAERSALLDITNDSPIVGLTTAGHPEKTPSSAASAKSRAAVPARKAGTPGSGETLLRGQVRTLLQKVEEDEQGEEVVSRISSGGHLPPFRALLNLPGPSPVQVLLAPTPANTPQIAGLAAPRDGVVVVAIEDCVKIDTPQAGLIEKEELFNAPAPECQINRALLFDSPGKSDSSSLTYQDSEISSTKSPDDDSSSAWSLQVNMSSHRDDDDEEEEEEEEFEEEEEEYEEEGDESFDDLCEGISKMSMGNEKVGLPEFTGMHTRFVYSRDDEEVIEREEVVKERVSPSAVLLKGLPVPKGKHMRFHDEEEEE